MQAFVDEFSPQASTTIIDIGGTPYNWQLIGASSDITMVNMTLPDSIESFPDNMHASIGDGTALEFDDDSFEIAFSNSVIEHVGDWNAQRAFADEVRRIGDGVWVQTPAREFPFEPHLLAPFIHWLPPKWQHRLIRRFTGWGIITKPSPEGVVAIVDELRLLRYKEMVELFPDCEIRRERFLGLTKAHVAVRPPG
jgi:hypothetical protein